MSIIYADPSYQVPPIIVQILSNKAVREKYSLKSVTGLYSGAAPLGVETITEVNQIFPDWKVCQGYGTLLLILSPCILVC